MCRCARLTAASNFSTVRTTTRTSSCPVNPHTCTLAAVCLHTYTLMPPVQLPAALPCLRDIQLRYDRSNMEAIAAASGGWPALAGVLKGLDLSVYPGPLPAKTLGHLAELGPALTRLNISGVCVCVLCVVSRELKLVWTGCIVWCTSVLAHTPALLPAAHLPPACTPSLLSFCTILFAPKSPTHPLQASTCSWRPHPLCLQPPSQLCGVYMSLSWPI